MRKIKQEEKIESIEVTKEAQINDDVILEAGDKVQVIREDRWGGVLDNPKAVIGLDYYTTAEKYDWHGVYPVVDKRTYTVVGVADAFPTGGKVRMLAGTPKGLVDPDEEFISFDGDAYWI